MKALTITLLMRARLTWDRYVARRTRERMRIRVGASSGWGRTTHPDTGAIPRHSDT